MDTARLPTKEGEEGVEEEHSERGERKKKRSASRTFTEECSNFARVVWQYINFRKENLFLTVFAFASLSAKPRMRLLACCCLTKSDSGIKAL